MDKIKPHLPYVALGAVALAAGIYFYTSTNKEKVSCVQDLNTVLKAINSKEPPMIRRVIDSGKPRVQ